MKVRRENHKNTSTEGLTKSFLKKKGLTAKDVMNTQSAEKKISCHRGTQRKNTENH